MKWNDVSMNHIQGATRKILA